MLLLLLLLLLLNNLVILSLEFNIKSLSVQPIGNYNKLNKRFG